MGAGEELRSAMLTVILRGLRARKVRLLLTGLSVVLGVSFLAGTFVFTDSVRASFDRVFASTAVDVDLVVRASSIGGASQRERIPDFEVEDVRSIEGVRSAEGVVQGVAKVVDRDGETIRNGLAPTVGMSWPADGDTGPVRLIDDGTSRAPTAPGEVVIDIRTAIDHGFVVGDIVGVQLGSQPVEPYTLVGVFEFGGISDLAGATFAGFEFGVAQEGFDAIGQLDFVNIRLDDGVDRVEIAGQIAAQLFPGLEVVDAQTAASDLADPLHNGLDILERILLAFAAIGVFVAAFIILNTFSVLVAQRTREIGLLRSLGASNRQIVLGVLAEALVVGVIASVLGILVGVGLVHALLAVFPDIGIQVPAGPTVVRVRTLAVAGSVGVVMTLVSSLIPALRAARVPPVVAHGATPSGSTRRSLALRSTAGAVVLVVGALTASIGVRRALDGFEVQIAAVALGCFAMFVAVVLLAPGFARIAVPVVANRVAAMLAGVAGGVLFVGAAIVAVGSLADDRPGVALAAGFAGVAGLALVGAIPTMQGVLAVLTRGNAARNPRRTTATASALVLGLAVVLLVAVLLSSVRTSLHGGLADGTDAEIVLSSANFVPISKEAVAETLEDPGVSSAAVISFGYASIADVTELVAGVDPDGFTEVLDPGFTQGGPAGFESGVLISTDAAQRLGIGIGDEVDLAFSAFGARRLPVVGIYDNRTFTGSVIVDFMVSDRVFEDAFGSDAPPTLAFLATADERGTGALLHTLRDHLRSRYPDIRVQTVDEFRAEQDRQIDLIVNALLALLAFSLMIAVLGIVNTLLLSVYERTRELGLLRTLGMTTRQMRRMVRGEAIVIAMIGSALGLALGVVWGIVFARALEPEGVSRVSVPVFQVLVFGVLASAAGVVASVAPAWRASRLDVLEAVAEE